MQELILGQPDPQNPERGNLLAYFRLALHDIGKQDTTYGVSLDSDAETEGHLIAAFVDLAQQDEQMKTVLVAAVMEIAQLELAAMESLQLPLN